MKLPTLIYLFVTALVILVVSSCHPNTPENADAHVSAFNLDSAKQSIEHQNAAFQKAFETSDSTGLANLFTSDGKMMMPGSPSIVGRAAIMSTVAMFMKMNIVRKAETIGVWGNDDILVEEGVASLFDQKGVELDHAKYLVMWKKEDGQWKLFRDMWNTD